MSRIILYGGTDISVKCLKNVDSTLSLELFHTISSGTLNETGVLGTGTEFE